MSFDPSSTHGLHDSKNVREKQLLIKLKQQIDTRNKINKRQDAQSKNYENLLTNDKEREKFEKKFEEHFLLEMAEQNIKHEKLEHNRNNVKSYFSSLKDKADLQRLKEIYQIFIKNKIEALRLDSQSRISDSEKSPIIMKDEILTNLTDYELRSALEKENYLKKEIDEKAHYLQDRFLETIGNDTTKDSTKGKTLIEQFEEVRSEVDPELSKILLHKKTIESELRNLTEDKNLAEKETEISDLQKQIEKELLLQKLDREQKSLALEKIKVTHINELEKGKKIKTEIVALEKLNKDIDKELARFSSEINMKKIEIKDLERLYDVENRETKIQLEKLKEDRNELLKLISKNKDEIQEKKNKMEETLASMAKEGVDPTIKMIAKVLPLLRQETVKKIDRKKLNEREWQWILDALYEKQKGKLHNPTNAELKNLKNQLKENLSVFRLSENTNTIHDTSVLQKINELTNGWRSTLGNYYVKHIHHQELVNNSLRFEVEYERLKEVSSIENLKLKNDILNLDTAIDSLQKKMPDDRNIAEYRLELERLERNLASKKTEHASNLRKNVEKQTDLQNIVRNTPELQNLKDDPNIKLRLDALFLKQNALIFQRDERKQKVKNLEKNLETTNLDLKNKQYLSIELLDKLIESLEKSPKLQTALIKLREGQVQIFKDELEKIVIDPHSNLWQLTKDKLQNKNNVTIDRLTEHLGLVLGLDLSKDNDKDLLYEAIFALHNDDFFDVMELFALEKIRTNYDINTHKLEASMISALSSFIHNIVTGKAELNDLYEKNIYPTLNINIEDQAIWNRLTSEDETFILKLIENARNTIENLNERNLVYDYKNKIDALNKIAERIRVKISTQKDMDTRNLNLFKEREVSQFLSDITLIAKAMTEKTEAFEDPSIIDRTSNLRMGKILDFIAFNDELGQKTAAQIINSWQEVLADKLKNAAEELDITKKEAVFENIRQHITSLKPLLRQKLYTKDLYLDDLGEQLLRKDPSEKILNNMVEEMTERLKKIQENFSSFQLKPGQSIESISTQKLDSNKNVQQYIDGWEKEKQSFIDEERQKATLKRSIEPRKTLNSDQKMLWNTIKQSLNDLSELLGRDDVNVYLDPLVFHNLRIEWLDNINEIALEYVKDPSNSKQYSQLINSLTEFSKNVISLLPPGDAAGNEIVSNFSDNIASYLQAISDAAARSKISEISVEAFNKRYLSQALDDWRSKRATLDKKQELDSHQSQKAEKSITETHTITSILQNKDSHISPEDLKKLRDESVRLYDEIESLKKQLDIADSEKLKANLAVEKLTRLYQVEIAGMLEQLNLHEKTISEHNAALLNQEAQLKAVFTEDRRKLQEAYEKQIEALKERQILLERLLEQNKAAALVKEKQMTAQSRTSNEVSDSSTSMATLQFQAEVPRVRSRPSSKTGPRIQMGLETEATSDIDMTSNKDNSSLNDVSSQSKPESKAESKPELDFEASSIKGSGIVGGMFDLVKRRAGKIGRKSKDKPDLAHSLILDNKAWDDYVNKMKKTISKKAEMKDLDKEDSKELEALFKVRKDAGSQYTKEQWRDNRLDKVDIYRGWRVDNSGVKDPSISFEIQCKIDDSDDSNNFVTMATVRRDTKNKLIEFVSKETHPDDITILMMLEHARETAKRTGKWEIKISDCEDSPLEAHKIEVLALKMKLRPIFDKTSQEALDRYRHKEGIEAPLPSEDFPGPNNPKGTGGNLQFRGGA